MRPLDSDQSINHIHITRPDIIFPRLRFCSPFLIHLISQTSVQDFSTPMQTPHVLSGLGRTEMASLFVLQDVFLSADDRCPDPPCRPSHMEIFGCVRVVSTRTP